MKNNRHFETMYCPKCGSPLFLHNLVFLDEGGEIIGCSDCLKYSDFDSVIDEMEVKEFIEQNYVTYIDHQIDVIKENW